MAKCNMELGKYMARCMLHRGDVMTKDINYAIQNIKQRASIEFVEIGIIDRPPKYLPEFGCVDAWRIDDCIKHVDRRRLW